MSARTSARASAVAAIVIEELDERDVALRIARDDRMGRIEERLTVLLEGRGLGDALLFGLALLQLRHRLLEEFRVLQQIIPHDLADGLALLLVEG